MARGHSKCRLVVVGAGPSGIIFLHRLRQLIERHGLGENDLEVICYEKGSTFGGMWVYDEKIGDDVHASMYRGMWTNSPKETMEVPSYSFHDHFGDKPMGSVMPPEVMLDYLGGIVKQSNLERYIRYNTKVNSVEWFEADQCFELTMSEDDVALPPQTFDYAIIATGHYSKPNYIPEVMDKLQGFTGKVLHSHDFRDARDFEDEQILLIGNGYSGEDIAVQLMKGDVAQHVTIAVHSDKREFKWPKGVDERPMIVSTNGKNAKFGDGTTGTFDTVILCTGYHHSYPFMEDALELKTPRKFYTPLYKGVVFPSRPELFYLGSQHLAYSFNMFEVQSAYIFDVILGHQSLPSTSEMEQDIARWAAAEDKVTSEPEIIDLVTEYLVGLKKLLGDKYPHKIDTSHIFKRWFEHRAAEDFVLYRDQTYQSIHSGVVSHAPITPWWRNLDNSFDGYFKNYAA